MQWVIFAVMSVGAAALGFGIVLAAAYVERARRVRHNEMSGDH